MSSIETRDVKLEAVDGRTLIGTAYQPLGGAENTLLVNSAMATPRSFYHPLAEWFAREGFAVLTFDYRGIGDSIRGSVSESEATLEDWARKDIRGGIDWLREEWPTLNPYVLGHSMGGQVMGLLGGEVTIKGLVTFSAQSGYWRIQYPGQRLKLLIASYVIFPVLTKVFGYLPWSKLFGGEDIPPGVARQWYGWCRNREYLLDDESLEGRENYRRFAAPILAYSFEDDTWGYSKAVDRMMSAYTNAPVERVHLDPQEVGLDSIGHFGFFDPDRNVLWEDLRDRMLEL